MTSMSDGFIAALKAGFLATKKRPTTVIARLHFKDLLLLNHNKLIKYCLSKSFTYHQKLSTPAHCPFFISQSSFCKPTDDQNNEKPHQDGQKIFLDSLFEHSFP